MDEILGTIAEAIANAVAESRRRSAERPGTAVAPRPPGGPTPPLPRPVAAAPPPASSPPASPPPVRRVLQPVVRRTDLPAPVATAPTAAASPLAAAFGTPQALAVTLVAAEILGPPLSLRRP